MQAIPLWLQQVFSDWLTGRIYVDGRGNYRSRLHRRPIIPCNRSLKRLYPDNQAFHRAAQIWLELWDVVPLTRLTRNDATDLEGRS
jgi:hypothetical protein